MLQRILDSDTIRGQIIRLTQPAGPGTVVLDLLLQQSNRLDVPPTYWRISAHQAREFTISEREFDSIRRVDRHPLLWTHTQDELELFVQLLLLGRSFVIAEAFDAEPISTPP